MATYRCILCHKPRVGRFTRRKDQAGGGWDQGRHLPAWYCYTCLPAGQGRDEEEEPVAKTTVVSSPKRITFSENPSAITRFEPAPSDAKAKAEVMLVASSLKDEVTELTVTDAGSYAYADSLLGRVLSAKKTWAGIWGRIQEKTIKPIRSGLEGLYEMDREVSKPLVALETSVKKTMGDYKREEARQLQEAERARQAELARLQEEANERIRQAQLAATPQMKGRLTAAAARLQNEAAAVAVQEAPEAVQGEHSGTRTVPAWRIVNLDAFLAAVGGYHERDMTSLPTANTPPPECVIINTVYINKLFKTSPEVVASWPGVEVFDDQKIVGR